MVFTHVTSAYSIAFKFAAPPNTTAATKMAYHKKFFEEWTAEQTLRRPTMRPSEPAFYRRLEQTLDSHREKGALIILKPRWDDTVIDFTSSDFLS
jgi:8-amino-7-oxononanoate synthase